MVNTGAAVPPLPGGTFRSFGIRDFRLWIAGATVSNIGTWMQRTAQDWLVLNDLGHGSATPLGIVLGLQFGPQILLLPLTGYAADRFDRRKLLLVTQVAMGLLALGMGALTLSGAASLWHVYVFAFLLGCAAAFDAPARQSFVSEVVPESYLSNAVALNSTSFNAARTIGPAIGGLLIAGIGTGWVFVLNAVTYLAVIASLLRLDVAALYRAKLRGPAPGGIAEGFRYVRGRPEIASVLLMLFVFGTFGINYPIFISTMSVTVFHVGAGRFGLLTSMMAIGSVIGALLSARRSSPSVRNLLIAALLFGTSFVAGMAMPTFFLFGCTLVAVGAASQTFTTTANGAIQLWTDAGMRGRVIAILLALTMGGTPIGAPIVGWVADHFGARAALGVGAGAGFVVAALALRHLTRFGAAPPARPAPVEAARVEANVLALEEEQAG